LVSAAPPTTGADPSDGVDLSDLDEVGANIVREELRLLAVVQRALLSAERGLGQGGHELRRDDSRLLELRDEVAVAKPEDLPTLFDLMHTLGSLRAQRGKGVTGSIDPASPYFGHLRLEEGGKRRDVLIGGRSYVDSAAGIRIVDWRNAPVSRIYYRYQEGDDYEEELGDRMVEGRVLARRSVAIVRGQLMRVASGEGAFARGKSGRFARVEATEAKLMTPRRWDGAPGADAENKGEGTTADGTVGRARLGVGADGQARQDKLLPAIAAMLDKAQFELIARPSSGLVAIQGSAGSGKTTVGLHRVAYLTFADPKRFRPERMLVVVPHDALVHYVGRVLPELGVEGVPVVTFARFASSRLSALLPKLPTEFTDETPPVVSRVKTSCAMLAAIEREGERAAGRLDALVQEQMERWPAGGDVIAAWQATRGAPDARVTALARWDAGKNHLGGIRSASELPQVTRGALEQLGRAMRRHSRDVLGVFDDLLTNRARLAETFAGDGNFGPAQLDRVHEWCVRRARLRADGERDGERAALDTEDMAVLLRIWQVLRGPLPEADGRALSFAHAFVDEVQDTSPLELKVLIELVDATSGRNPREKSVTLAGDLAQRTFTQGEDRGEFDWETTLAALGVAADGPTSTEALRVSYRSTAEITTFARAVLGPLAHEAEPIATRRGPPVELFTFTSMGESVAWLADALRQLARDDPQANVALIARFAPHADAYFEGLSRAEVPRLRRVAKQDFTWEPGVDVTDIRQTKGLEFDEVVLLETTAASYPDSAPARHALYVGATRAAHQLWCVSSQAPSPLIENAMEAATRS
jgi:DNA helicase II / ATP-dependent DNA helicase PcrA